MGINTSRRNSWCAGIVSAVILTVCTSGWLSAQRQWETWAFGFGGCVNVGSDTPYPLEPSEMLQQEGCAAVSDPHTGELLFYTDGITIWNGLHVPISSRWRLRGNYSTTQSALIIPRPGHNLQYYLFTVGVSEIVGFDPTVRMTIVDMAASGGMGEIVMEPVVIGTDLGEKLIAVPHGDGCSYWIIGHRFYTNEFVSWNIGGRGIEEMVVTPIGKPVFPGGYLKASPDGTMLAMGSTSLGSLVENVSIQLFQFNDRTGVPSDAVDLEGLYESYGVSFSPNSKKLYLGVKSVDTRINRIVQYDISNYDALTINLTKTVVIEDMLEDFIGDFGALQLAPNGKLYISRLRSAYLEEIANPNGPAPLCNYRHDAVPVALRRRAYAGVGLPNVIDGELYQPPRVCDHPAEMDGSNLLFPARPLPADQSATISYSLRTAAWVVLDLFDVKGKIVRRLVDAYIPFVDVQNEILETGPLPAGTYYVQMRVGDWTALQRLLVVH